jgi:putative endonuclease
LSEARSFDNERPALDMYYIYILQSLKDNKTYVGYTANLTERLNYHNSGRVLATKHRRPLKLLLSENFSTIKEVKSREQYWKNGGGRRKLKQYFKEGFPSI